MQHDPTDTLSVLLQLARRARQAENAQVLGFVACNESRTLLNYRQAALWQAERGLCTVSGLPDIEHDAPFGQWLNRLCTCLPAGGTHQLDATALPDYVPPEIAADWDDWLPPHLLAIPWTGPASNTPMYWLLARDEPWEEAEITIAGELADIYGHAWRTFRPHPGWRAEIRRWWQNRRHRRLTLTALALTLCFPVRLSVLAPAEVIPKDALPVRAPLEGVVDNLHVRPNQPVKQGQALFDLDTTSLRTRLSVARKAHEAAAEEYRQAAQLAVADDERGRLEISQRKGRLEEKAAELAYSEQLLDRVQVKAARDGVAVFSDTADWIGRAVLIGERVMQIADPAQVAIRINLPAADAIDLAQDASVKLFLTNSPQLSYAGQLIYSAYQAEVTAENIVAYTLKADFASNETLPRLGLTGTAKLYGHWAPFAYYLLRRPLAAARQWVGW